MFSVGRCLQAVAVYDKWRFYICSPVSGDSDSTSDTESVAELILSLSTNSRHHGGNVRRDDQHEARRCQRGKALSHQRQILCVVHLHPKGEQRCITSQGYYFRPSDDLKASKSWLVRFAHAFIKTERKTIKHDCQDGR